MKAAVLTFPTNVCLLVEAAAYSNNGNEPDTLSQLVLTWPIDAPRFRTVLTRPANSASNVAEKIEELTLYMIQANERIEQLEKKVNKNSSTAKPTSSS